MHGPLANLDRSRDIAERRSPGMSCGAERREAGRDRLLQLLGQLDLPRPPVHDPLGPDVGAPVGP